ncbi:MAG: hypothetical protein DME34_01455 [Verrucomicrobia bacterium]|nr:MAG: hypothetical protein DME34_01455 [Verrucomicrobiota bacterium]
MESGFASAEWFRCHRQHPAQTSAPLASTRSRSCRSSWQDERRIGFEGGEFFTEVLPHEVFLPAGGQGVIAIQLRSNDERTRLLVEPLNDFDTRLCLRAEREFLRLLHADCNQPVGVLATLDGTVMKIRAQVFALGATAPSEASVTGPSEEAERLAAELWRQIDAARARA